ncbi:MAG: metal-dependent transcriptional regulator [Anaerovorax sp.]
MNIHESAENYLEVILILKERLGAVRSIDIATELNYSKPSVSIAMKKLRENEYITINSDGYITLSETGMAIADSIYERHLSITNFLIQLGVTPEVASQDACKIEHDISDETFEKIMQHVEEHSSHHVK